MVLCLWWRCFCGGGGSGSGGIGGVGDGGDGSFLVVML